MVQWLQTSAVCFLRRQVFLKRKCGGSLLAAWRRHLDRHAMMSVTRPVKPHFFEPHGEEHSFEDMLRHRSYMIQIWSKYDPNMIQFFHITIHYTKKSVWSEVYNQPSGCKSLLSWVMFWSCQVHKYEMAKAVKALCWPGEFRILWKALDKDKSGLVSYQELDMQGAEVLAEFKYLGNKLGRWCW